MQSAPHRSSAVNPGRVRASIRYGAWAARLTIPGLRLLPLVFAWMIVPALAASAPTPADPVRLLAFRDSLTGGLRLTQGERLAVGRENIVEGKEVVGSVDVRGSRVNKKK